MKKNLKKTATEVILIVLTIAIAIAIGSQLPKLYQKWRGPFKTGDYSMHVATSGKPITLYGTSTCPHCQTAREYLTKNGIPFNDVLVDKSKSAEEAYTSLNERGVPVIVSAHKLMVGFNAKAYDELISSDVKK